MIVCPCQKVISYEMIIPIYKLYVFMIVKQTSWYIEVHEWYHCDKLQTEEQRPCVTHTNTKEKKSKQVQEYHDK